MVMREELKLRFITYFTIGEETEKHASEFEYRRYLKGNSKEAYKRALQKQES